MPRTPATRTKPSTLGTVRKLPSGRYQAFYRYEDRRITAPRTFATKTEADGWLATERADRVRGTWRDPQLDRVNLGGYLRDWLASREPRLSPRTAAGYRHSIEHWITPRLDANGQHIELGALDLAQVTTATVRKWFAVMSAAAEAASLQRLTYTPSGHPARLWARETGHPVADTGRIPPTLLDAWQRAGSPLPTPRRRPSAEGVDPGRATAAAAYATLRAALVSALDDGLIPANPCRIRGASSHTANERGTCTPAEVGALADAMPERYRAAVIVAAWSALRYGELFALARRHVDLDAGTLRVERALTAGARGTGKTKTRGSVRTVYLPRFVVDELRHHLDSYAGPRADALVFTTETGQPVTSRTLSRLFTRARAAIGRPELHWHDLRHTGATLAYREGASVKDVQRRLGHSTARAAMIYAHAADESDSLLAQRLDAAYSNVVPITAARTGSRTA